ncbi:transcriptional regulator [Ralstonia solanacearum]|nr:transcriptional regulator [Ralstonia solanacearum]
MKIDCPHCSNVAHIRSSRRVTRFTRELYCQCSNLVCSHTFVALTEVVRTLAPSNTPDAEVAQQLAARSATGT